MLDHLSIQCADVGAATAFYDTVLAPLGGGRIMELGTVVGYGLGQKPSFWIGPLADDVPNREVHIAFVAPDRAAVRACFDAAVGAGAEVLHEPLRVARVPPGLLRRVRARSRRQQRGSRLSRPGVTADDELVRRARAVLDRNRRGAYTCPSVTLYPHQWLWDSCFTAIGIARYDPARAAEELRALFRGQWDNGMLPHMIFAEGSKDVGSRRVWQSSRHPDAPRAVATTCITQPPVAALAVARSPTRSAPTTGARSSTRWCRSSSPTTPGCSATDDSTAPRSSPSSTRGSAASTPPRRGCTRCAHARMPWYLRVAERLHLARLLRSLRYDTRYLPATERASDDDGLRMLALAIHARRYDFDLRRMPRTGSVLIEDVGFNAFFAAANRALRSLGADLGELEPDIDAHAAAIEDLLARADGPVLLP